MRRIQEIAGALELIVQYYRLSSQPPKASAIIAKEVPRRKLFIGCPPIRILSRARSS